MKITQAMRELRLLPDGRTVVPRRFVASGDHEGLDLEMEVEVSDAGQVRCSRLTVRQPDSGVTSEALRKVPVTRLAREAAGVAASFFAFDGLTQEGEVKLVGPGPEKSREIYGRFLEMARQPRRGSPLTDDHLRAVVAMYKQALKEGDPPTRTIADEMHVARPTASRWVAKARERGFLGPAMRGRAGEGKS